MSEFTVEHVDTVVVGGGQAGLSVGYHLQRRNIPFVILDASERVGDTWRNRWDSLRLFTPARFCHLDGLAFPADPQHFPTKDEMADYLASYADHFQLPIHAGVEVDRLTRRDGHFRIAAGDVVFESEHVVVAIGSDQRPWVPSLAADLDPGIRQLHSVAYRRPEQLLPGDALVVGAGNSGVEIALDVREGRRVMLAGEYPGAIPFDIEGFLGRLILVRLVIRGVFHRLITIDNPLGRRAIDKLKPRGRPLVRTKPADIERAGIEHVPRVVGARDGRPVLADRRAVDVPNVIWATGFRPTLDWIDIDVLETDDRDSTEPRQRAGIVDEVPGLYFVGLDFQYAASSGQIHGVGRDAARVAAHLAEHRSQHRADRRAA